MEPRLYRTGPFAKLARISVRTLRFYDRIGLLAPSERSFSGHRLYAEPDLVALQRILALKLLGFSLAEIRAFAAASPQSLGIALTQQREMLREQRSRLDRALGAIEEVQGRLREGESEWESVLRVIELMQMNIDKSWVRKHLTPEQVAAVDEISGRAFAPETSARLAGRVWTEEDQIRVSEAWADVYMDAGRLARAGADPAGGEGRELGSRYKALIDEFTGGDPEVAAGLNRFYAEARKLPAEKSPYPDVPKEAREFAEKAYMAVR